MTERARPLILNVNVHEPSRSLAHETLTAAGFDTLGAATGAEALQQLHSLPNLVVLDLQLPDISGLELCRMIRASLEWRHLPVLVTSATFTTPERRIQGLQSGADLYLVCPYEPLELVAAVRALLRLGQAEAELHRRVEELAAADRQKDEFVARLAHDLRNPLAEITSSLPLLDVHRRDDVRFAEVRGVLARQSEQLSRLVDDLVDVARITHGRIELRERHGAPFEVELPLTTEPVKVAEPAARLDQLPEARGPGRRVLVIEDNPDARESLKDVLELLGHTVEAASDGMEGLKVVETFLPDVVLTDIGLPEMDGYAVGRAIRQLEAGKKLFLVALTGYGGREMRDKALAAGFNLHVVKPCDANVLAKILQNT